MNDNAKELLSSRLELEYNNAPSFDTTFNVNAYLNILRYLQGVLEDLHWPDVSSLVRSVWHYWGDMTIPSEIAARSKVIDILFDVTRELEKREKVVCGNQN